MKAVYPVIFTKKNDEKDTILIEIPDMDLITEGFGMNEAIAMARDAMELRCVNFEDKGKQIPPPSEVSRVDLSQSRFCDAGTSVVSLVDIDSEAYRRKLSTETVRRNVTLPFWMDYEVRKRKINVSRVLQKALGEMLQVRNPQSP